MTRSPKPRGTVDKTCAMVASLIRGAVHDRQTLAETFDVEVAAADRYIRSLSRVPGVTHVRHGRRLTIRWYFTAAIKEAGL
jgi:hypothetical protein